MCLKLALIRTENGIHNCLSLRIFEKQKWCKYKNTFLFEIENDSKTIKWKLWIRPNCNSLRNLMKNENTLLDPFQKETVACFKNKLDLTWKINTLTRSKAQAIFENEFDFTKKIKILSHLKARPIFKNEFDLIMKIKTLTNPKTRPIFLKWIRFNKKNKDPTLSQDSTHFLKWIWFNKWIFFFFHLLTWLGLKSWCELNRA